MPDHSKPLVVDVGRAVANQPGVNPMMVVMNAALGMDDGRLVDVPEGSFVRVTIEIVEGEVYA